MSKPKVPAWAKVQLTKAERDTLAYCVASDGAPADPDDANERRRFNYRLKKLWDKGVIRWNEDGVYLTELGRYIAMRNPATEPTR